MSLFKRLIDPAIRTNELDPVNQHLDIQKQTEMSDNARRRQRNRDTYEDYLDEKDRRRDAEKKVQELTDEKSVLTKVAVDIAVDRKAILNTIDYLAQKWGQPLKEEMEQRRGIERQALENNPNYIEQTTKAVDQVVESEVTRIRRTRK